mmetsp:Transcript_69700/g.199765  ORF Transcript_69700/g.199765 Transcript_69700/m.199765 type:complete len:273 (+) Transcript_69700:581-1399(+)
MVRDRAQVQGLVWALRGLLPSGPQLLAQLLALDAHGVHLQMKPLHLQLELLHLLPGLIGRLRLCTALPVHLLVALLQLRDLLLGRGLEDLERVRDEAAPRGRAAAVAEVELRGRPGAGLRGVAVGHTGWKQRTGQDLRWHRLNRQVLHGARRPFHHRCAHSHTTILRSPAEVPCPIVPHIHVEVGFPSLLEGVAAPARASLHQRAIGGQLEVRRQPPDVGAEGRQLGVVVGANFHLHHVGAVTVHEKHFEALVEDVHNPADVPALVRVREDL